MFSRLFSRKSKSKVPQELYGKVVMQSRNPVFFLRYGFQDSVTGRFDVLCIHLFLFSRRLVREDTPKTTSLNQEVFDIFIDSTDRALRELGVGDTSVPKRKKRLVHSFYATVGAFGAPLDDEDQKELSGAIEKRFEGAEEGIAGKVPAATLASYVLETAAGLDRQPAEQILKGRIEWCDPSAFFPN